MTSRALLATSLAIGLAGCFAPQEAIEPPPDGGEARLELEVGPEEPSRAVTLPVPSGAAGVELEVRATRLSQDPAVVDLEVRDSAGSLMATRTLRVEDESALLLALPVTDGEIRIVLRAAEGAARLSLALA